MRSVVVCIRHCGCSTDPDSLFPTVPPIHDSRTLPKRMKRELFLDGDLLTDTKPENVLLIEDEEDGEQAKVVDFGIAKILENSSPLGDSLRTDSHANLGTALYMAPERFEGAPGDPRMDVYALGLLLHELLTGLLPFAKRYDDRQDGTALLHKRFTEDVPPLQLQQPISSALQTLLGQMLDRNAANRPAHAGVVRDRFREIPEIQAISAGIPERSGLTVVPAGILAGSTVSSTEGQTTSASVAAVGFRTKWVLFPLLLAVGITASVAVWWFWVR